MIGCTKLLCGTATIADLLREDAGRQAHLLQFSTALRPIVVWNITQRCNLACAHCYLDASDRAAREELSTDEAQAFMDDVAAMGCPVLLLSGGEPLLRPDVLDLGRFAIARGLRVVLSSNGTLLTPQLAAEIAAVGFSYVGVSIDGARATHDAFRRKAGAFDAALTGIRHCLAAGVKAGVRMTLNRRNAADLDAVLDLVEAERIPRFCLYHLVYAGRGREMLADDLPPDQTRPLIEHLLDRTADWHRRGIETEILTTDNHADGILVARRVAAEDPDRLPEVRELLRLHGGCSAGTKMANVDARGNVHPCQFWSHVSLGNVRERPFSAIWADESHPLLAKLRHLADHLTGERCGACSFKTLCGGCRIRAEVVHGDTWGDDPACFLTREEITTETPRTTRNTEKSTSQVSEEGESKITTEAPRMTRSTEKTGTRVMKKTARGAMVEHDPQTEAIIGAAIKVHQTLGPGLLESVYEECLCRELALRSIPFERQRPVPLTYEGQTIPAGFRLDLLVEGQIVVEVKAVEPLLPVHTAQLLSYMKLGGWQRGLLINFNVPVLREGIRRFAL